VATGPSHNRQEFDGALYVGGHGVDFLLSVAD